MTYFKANLVDLSLFTLYLKAAILLVRLLAKKHQIQLSKTGRYSPYIVSFGIKDRDWFQVEYYNNKIFFNKEDHNPAKSGVLTDLVSLELTPIYLNHDYYSLIKTIFQGLREGRLEASTYGFSQDNVAFDGEMLNLSEGLLHYDYVSTQMICISSRQMWGGPAGWTSNGI